MKMYDIGRRYRYQNQIGEFAFLNRQECTVIGAPKLYTHPAGFPIWGQRTDTYCEQPNKCFIAVRGDLLPVEDDDNVEQDRQDVGVFA